MQMSAELVGQVGSDTLGMVANEQLSLEFGKDYCHAMSLLTQSAF